MPIAGKAFDYTVKGKKTSQMRQTIGETAEAEKIKAAKERRNAQKRISKKKAPVRKMLKSLGWMQT